MTSTTETSSDISLSDLDSEMIHIQMNNYDSYMCKPSTLLDTNHGTSLPLNKYEYVPVIRIYGNIPSGHQTLCHVHGIFPYIFIPYDGEFKNETSTIVNQKCTQLHLTLENRIRVLFFQNKKSKNQDKGPGYNSGEKPESPINQLGNLKYIANVSVVKGMPFYGYHTNWSLFYKICLLNPSHVHRVTDLIRNGAALNSDIEVFEAHIPYILQFLTDFNLFGCYWIKLQKCYFRQPVLNELLDINNLTMTQELDQFLAKFVKDGFNVLHNAEFRRVGNGLLEMDILPNFIRNIDELHHTDIQRVFYRKSEDKEEPDKTQYVTSTKRMATDIAVLRQMVGLKKYRVAPDVERLSDFNADWQYSKENKNLYDKAMNCTNALFNETSSMDDFMKNKDVYANVPRPFESLPDLWPQEPDVLRKPPHSQMGPPATVSNNTVPQETYHGTHDEQHNEMQLDDNLNKNETDPFDEPDDLGDLGESNKMYEDVSLTQKFSMDKELTQSMAKKKENHLPREPNLHSTSEVIKRKGIVSKRKTSNAGHSTYIFKKPKVDFKTILDDLCDQGHPKIDYQDPYFSNPIDLEEKPYVYAGKRFEITSTHLSDRIPITFNSDSIVSKSKTVTKLFNTWKYIKKPPSFQKVTNECKEQRIKKDQSQIEKYSDSKFGYKYKSPGSYKKKEKKIHDQLTHMSLEVHVNTRGDKNPDPLIDEVVIIFWCIDNETYPFELPLETEGIMCVIDDFSNKHQMTKIEQACHPLTVAFYEKEFDMFDALTDLVLLFDPDILSGFEVHMSSWGYIIDRCNKIHKFDFISELARTSQQRKSKGKDAWGHNHSTDITITGRHMLNIWRLMRSNLTLTQYTIENIAYHLLHYRLPRYSYKSLTCMWNVNEMVSSLKTVIMYWQTRVRINIEILTKDDFIARTTEFSRLLGIDFHSVYHRGSQYRVESFLRRICGSENFLLLSPSKIAVKEQKALECVPLIMEPESAFYKSPLVVLDFQSLYPSVMVAQNYCYSTMIGKVGDLNLEDNKIGVTKVHLEKGVLKILKDDVNISPNGIVYVKPDIRKSMLAKMLTEILDLRVMVKKTMSQLDDPPASLKKQLNNRQVALKLLANVTYGYTSASFSGRMPCSELADSIVQTGREILQKAIDLIEMNDHWGAKVVYGDTDSLFVYLPGKSKEDAFRIGEEISIAVSKANPAPIFLKFEKVYHPSILVSKKRYVGYAFEKRNQKEPIFDAKGIETIRRDGHPAQQKIVEKSLRLLFDTKDLSAVKKYVQEQFTKIEENNVSIQDFCFAKEVKLGAYKSEQTAPPGAVVAARQNEHDHRAHPQYKERIPYVVIRGKAGDTLRSRSISPAEFLANPNCLLDAEYYIMKTLVPPLSRLFNIMGINVTEWTYDLTRFNRHSAVGNKLTDNVGTSQLCTNCSTNVISSENSLLCLKCEQDRSGTVANLLIDKLSRVETMSRLDTVCRVCSYKYSRDASYQGESFARSCESYDCPIYYQRIKADRKLIDNNAIRKQMLLESLNDW
ncbi:DNA-directed DNA polymerase KNAG_0J01820 [Huiozyma naganishii CBS 8797]|uniref:DNA polymerase n=1 Tax=Huiozyma naganishii (strain ATCC MYA-139 / BCRC 22969 / CBS 8797 / KCTC 17520 / NBRC 10181 / NCYC 3082 / Yp74L-3) TaxID=1071383 RepID=J7RR04_HUIN7|nr:hypothetical protein KNAG_0J01820 [Kazachstania naganishii CBS 8797]CCK72263.1 hypothetical protein KNAG_0J01820 [Kazachstania naganishii CBS 8797]